MGIVKVTSLIINAGSGPGFSFGVRAWTEMEIWCVNGMFMLKVVSSQKKFGFTGMTVNPKLFSVETTFSKCTSLTLYIFISV